MIETETAGNAPAARTGGAEVDDLLERMREAVERTREVIEATRETLSRPPGTGGDAQAGGD
jgi:hypothetical protein